MKISKINTLFVFIAAGLMTLLMTSCGQESPFSNGDSDQYGELSTKQMMLTVDNSENTRASVDVNSFKVEIYKDGVLKNSYTYSDMPEVITLPVGDYTVKARSGEVEAAAWESPYYEGEENFSIVAKKITEVKTVVCRLANVKVTVLFDEKLKEAMADDAYVEVKLCENSNTESSGSSALQFTKNNTKSGYFAYKDGLSTMVATFHGTIDGEEQNDFKTYTDVAPSNHYKIIFRYHEGVITEPGGSIGTDNSTIQVDVEVESTDLTVDNNPDDDPILSDDKRPTEGDDPSQDPGTDDPSTGEDGPSITAVAPIDLSKNNDVYADSTVKLLVTSEQGIEEFKVVIDSPILTEETLEGVGLLKSLDLINPSGVLQTNENPDYYKGETIEYGQKLLDLGLPCNVEGLKSVEFDISGFINMLNALGEATHKFTLTVGDASGSVTKTLTITNHK